MTKTPAQPLQLTELVARAYEAATDRLGVERYLPDLLRYFDADAGCLVIWTTGLPANVVTITHGLDAAEVQRWFAARDRTGSLFARLGDRSPGDVLTSSAGNGDGNGDTPGDQVLATLIAHDAHNESALILLRNAQRPAFTGAAAADLGKLSVYLGRAVAMNKRFVRAMCGFTAARSVMERGPRGMAVIGQRGQVTLINARLREIVGEADGLRLTGNELRLDDAASQARLDAFIAGLQADAGNMPVNGDSVLTLPVPRHAEDALPYQLMVLSMPCDPLQAILDDEHGLAAIIVHDPEVNRGISQDILITFFNLTPAEAKLARALLMAHSIPAAAATLGISANTARSQLKSIFQKCGVNSQPALLQRLSQSLDVILPSGQLN